MASRRIISLAQFRLGRYADALATLRQNDARKLSLLAGSLMSPWNPLTLIEFDNRVPPPGSFRNPQPEGWRITRQFTFDPTDFALREVSPSFRAGQGG